jgi:hypothetical protein
MNQDKTPLHIRLDERNHVEKPLLDQLHGLGLEINAGRADNTFRKEFFII